MHTADFFRDEVRNGFYIPTAIKQAWAAELDVLAEIERICRKYGITYYADWGTFLGAVRHGGFVPWDDDLDICMRRDDYQKFRAVADRELPEEFCIHDYERKEDHWLFLARIVQSRKICFEKEHLLKYHNFPWVCGVDIFLQDYLYKDEEEEKGRCKEVLQIIAVADGITGGDLSRQAIQANVNEFSRHYSVELPSLDRKRELAVALYRLAEEQMSRVRPQDSDTLGQIFPWILKGGKGQPKVYYEKAVRLPFEDTTIPVPAYYNTLLKSRYGNYQEIRKVWTGHNYPFFEGAKADLEQIAGEKLFDYTFQKEMLVRPKVDRSNSLKSTAAECIDELRSRHKIMEAAREIGDMAQVENTLSECQQIAVDLGNLIEQTKGGESLVAREVVGTLENYCEALYQSSLNGDLSGVLVAFEAVSEAVRTCIADRREILFLPVGVREWRGFVPTYESVLSEENADVSIVPLPLLTKDPYGQVNMTDEEIMAAAHSSDYPDDIEIMDWAAYDVSIHCPDVIYIQNPYDRKNPYLTVPPEFYAEYLRNYTERLVFVPFADTAEFGREDYNDQYNMKHYVTAPGILYADQVCVQSENIREQYVSKLTEFAGTDTENFWKEKITVREKGSLRTDRAAEKCRKLVYCIGVNELSEQRENFLEAIKERFDTFRESGAELTIGLSLYPPDRLQWRAVNEELSAEFFTMFDDALKNTRYELCEFTLVDAEQVVSDYDAYYGSPSPLVPLFVKAGKPVMLCDYGLEAG